MTVRRGRIDFSIARHNLASIQGKWAVLVPTADSNCEPQYYPDVAGVPAFRAWPVGFAGWAIPCFFGGSVLKMIN